MTKSGLRNHSFVRTEMIPLFLLLVCGLSSAAETGLTYFLATGVVYETINSGGYLDQDTELPMIKRSLATYLKNRAANEAMARIARADDDAKGKFS